MVRRAARSSGGAWGLVGGQQWAEEPVVELGVEDGDLDPVGGQHVVVGVLDAADQAGDAQPAQVVGHLAGGVGRVQQSGHQGAQALVGDAGGREQGGAQGAGQGHDPRIAEPRGRVLRPSVSTEECAIGSMAGLARTQP